MKGSAQEFVLFVDFSMWEWGPKSSPDFVSLANSMEQRTEVCGDVSTAREPHEPADLTERDGGEAGNAGEKALRNAVRRALLCGQCRYRGNTIPLASIGKIANMEMIKSLHVSLGSASVGCRHLERLPVPETVSPVCPSPSNACQRRKRIVRGIRVWSFNAESCCAAGRLEELLHTAGQQDFHIACIQGTQLAFNSDWRTGEWQVYDLSKSGASWAQNPDWSKVFSTGSACLELLLADELSRSDVGGQRST